MVEKTKSDSDRPALRRLIQAVRDGQIDVVYVYDRVVLPKDLSAFVNALEELDQLGVEDPTVEQPPPDDELPG